MRAFVVLLLGALLYAGCASPDRRASQPGMASHRDDLPPPVTATEEGLVMGDVRPEGLATSGEDEAPEARGPTGGRDDVPASCPTPEVRPDDGQSTFGPLTFNGLAVGPSGTPLANARVAVYSRASPREGSSPCFAMEAEGTTDRRGRFDVTTSLLSTYSYPRWIEVERGELFGTLRRESMESTQQVRIIAHPTQRFEVEVHCERASSFTVPHSGVRLPEAPDLRVYRGTSGQERSVPLPPSGDRPGVFAAELRLRPGQQRLVFWGVCGVHTETVRVQRGMMDPRLSLTLPRPDVGAIEMSFDGPHISRVHLYVEGHRIDTVVHDHGAPDTIRIDDVSPGTYRLVRHLESTDPDCVHEVTVRPNETSHVSLLFARCLTPTRDDIR